MKKILILIAILGIILSGCSPNNESFTSLFNGKDLTNWEMPGEVPGFEVSGGIIVAEPPGESDLFTEKQFGNFIFRFEYLLSKVGNSGVLIRCDPEDPWGTGVEVQLLAPWTPYRDDLHCTGSIYGHVAVTNRPDETTGIWHEMEIKCDRKNISISVDGQVATVANIDTVASMKDKHLAGVIGFQSNHSEEGEFAHFRNISIRDLDANPGYVAKGFYEEDERVREQAHKAAETMGTPMIELLALMLTNENPVAQTGARQVLFDITAQSTTPDVPKSEKKDMIKALKKSLKNCSSETASGYLRWLLEMAKSTE
ncbi:MAG: DUF1080 domain-containing protein [Mangrovibacterium sp.]|nr:DUF1080 domain-containing protein [Mangrovibacterium sp.]